MKITYVEHTDLEEIVNELGICGCGNPELAYKAVHEMLKRSSYRQGVHLYSLRACTRV